MPECMTGTRQLLGTAGCVAGRTLLLGMAECMTGTRRLLGVAGCVWYKTAAGHGRTQTAEREASAGGHRACVVQFPWQGF
eukprot:359550-Chlamydomonas_euryale.AAC.4